jgi:hypothetical protein
LEELKGLRCQFGDENLSRCAVDEDEEGLEENICIEFQFSSEATSGQKIRESSGVVEQGEEDGNDEEPSIWS